MRHLLNRCGDHVDGIDEWSRVLPDAACGATRSGRGRPRTGWGFFYIYEATRRRHAAARTLDVDIPPSHRSGAPPGALLSGAHPNPDNHTSAGIRHSGRRRALAAFTAAARAGNPRLRRFHGCFTPPRAQLTVVATPRPPDASVQHAPTRASTPRELERTPSHPSTTFVAHAIAARSDERHRLCHTRCTRTPQHKRARARPTSRARALPTNRREGGSLT